MRGKIKKKGITRRLFSVALALAVVVGLVPLNSSTVYADAVWIKYEKDGVIIWYDKSTIEPDFGEGDLVLFDCNTCSPPGSFMWSEDFGWLEQHPCNHILTTNPHTHGSWAYTASGATLTAECKATTGTCDLPNHKVSLTLTASSANYSGSAAEVDYADGQADAWEAALGVTEVPEIKYYKQDGSTPTDIGNDGASAEGGAPKNAGKYVAKAVYTVPGSDPHVEKTISLNFEIKNHNLTPATATMARIILDDESFNPSGTYINIIYYQNSRTPEENDYIIYAKRGDDYSFAKYNSSNWVDGGTMTLDEIKTAVGQGSKIYVIGTVTAPSSSGGYYTPPATNATIGGETGSTTNVSVNTSGGQATVSDIPMNTVESIANSNANGGDIVLDVSKAGYSQVTKVTLTKNTVENISKALDADTNNKTNLVVKTGNAEVTFDATAVKAIAGQAKSESIQIVVENTVTTQLNDSQKKVVENLGKDNAMREVVQSFEVYVISGSTRISSFNGGLVKVGKIDYKIPAGKNPKHYFIYYLPENGEAVRFNTWVEGDTLFFRTSHFSDYVIVYDETVTNGEGIPVYRLYHNKLGDHLFTTSAAERDMAQKIGYKLEGVGFYASGTGKKVYRLFNKNSGEHFYTASEKERDLCKQRGWNLEGVAFTTEGEKKVYRLCNGRVHFYTSSEKEKDFCLAHGWKLEGIGFNAN